MAEKTIINRTFLFNRIEWKLLMATCVSEEKLLEVRKFGFLVCGLLVILGGYRLFFSKQGGLQFILLGGAFALSGWARPSLIAPVYRVWVAFGNIMHWVMSRVLLIIVFFLFITPLGFLSHLLKYRTLATEIAPKSVSYWIRRKSIDRAACERQY